MFVVHLNGVLIDLVFDPQASSASVMAGDIGGGGPAPQEAQDALGLEVVEAWRTSDG